MPQLSAKHGHKWDGSDCGEGWQRKNLEVKVNVVDENRKPVHAPGGEIMKKKVKCVMQPSRMAHLSRYTTQKVTNEWEYSKAWLSSSMHWVLWISQKLS
jgi:hypothetical protein